MSLSDERTHIPLTTPDHVTPRVESLEILRVTDRQSASAFRVTRQSSASDTPLSVLSALLDTVTNHIYTYLLLLEIYNDYLLIIKSIL